MNHAEPLVDGLEQIRKGELHASEYYAVAHTSAEKHGRPDMAVTYKSIGAVHASFALQIEGRKEELEKEAGEGIFGEMFENVKEAVRAFVADLPVLFLEKETEPTPTMLIGLERDLATKYSELVGAADEKTADILNRAIEAGQRHIQELETFGG